MAATGTPDRDLSEAAFHSKYGFLSGWDAAREVVLSAIRDNRDPHTRKILDALWNSLNEQRAVRRDEYVQQIEL